MGMLIDGKWQEQPHLYGDNKKRYPRHSGVFRNRIKNDNSSRYLAEANRYHLYVSFACPWSSRVIIFYMLKGLQNIISLSSLEPVMQKNGWEFGDANTETHDPLYQARYLYELYIKTDPTHTGRVTLPVLWDKHTNTIVNNDSVEIVHILNSEFNDLIDNRYDFCPSEHVNEIDQLNQFIYENINDGVYHCGYAKSQQEYDIAFDRLYSALDTLEERLSKHRYLIGNQLTEPDWLLFPTLIRFDTVYFINFKCNLRRIIDYPNLSAYLRDLYQTPGIKETVNFMQIKQHYFIGHNNTRHVSIIPKGPKLNLDFPHHRERMF
jgi:glutathionyl-hydroquinone reductase